jgi:hypothetical protein
MFLFSQNAPCVKRMRGVVDELCMVNAIIA